MFVIYVLAILYVNDELLLVRRKHLDFGHGCYSLIGGKVEQNERALYAIRREVREETGLDLPEETFSLVHTFHRLGTEGPFIALCFKANIAGMHPVNAEPDKHDDMRMFPFDQLPATLLPAHQQIISCVQKDILYSEHGW